MNWTGGRLSRGARNASVKDKQRQHFARVRNNLINGKSNASPIGWATFHEIPPSAKSISRAGDDSRSVRAEIASIQEQYGPRLPKHQTAQQASQRNGSGRRSANLETSEDTASPMTRSDYRSLSSSHALHHVVETFRHPRAHRSQRRASEKQPIEEYDRLPIPDGLDENRLKLLLREDWTGLNFQRSVKIKFSSARDGDMIGKRRKLSDGHRARYGVRLLSSPFAPPRLRQSTLFDTAVAKDDRIYLDKHSGPKEKARIIIGGCKKRAKLSSSTSRSNPLQNSEGINIETPDIMLLDQDENERLDENSLDGYENDISDDTHITLPTRPRHISQQETAPRHNSLARSQNDESPVLPIHCYVDPVASVQKFCSMSSLQDPNQRQGASFRERDPPSVGVLLHPVPRSSKISQIILSSPIIASSTAGQLGMMDPTVPEYEKLDDEIWKTWVIQLDEGELVTDDENQRETVENVYLRNRRCVRISPGVSTFDIQANDGYEEKPPRDQTEHQARGKHQQREISSNTYPDSKRLCEIQDDNGRSLAEERVHRLNDGDEIANAKLRGIFSAMGQKSDQPPLKVLRQEDPDTCWKRFVFPSDYDEDEEQNEHTWNSVSVWATPIRKSPTSTVLAQASGETEQSRKRSPAPSSTFVEPDLSADVGQPFQENNYQVVGESQYLELDPTPATYALASDSTIAHRPSQSDDETSQAENASRTLRRRLVFTKPTPFKGQFITSVLGAPLGDPTHIGRRCMRTDREKIEAKDVQNLENFEDIEDD